MKTRKWPSKSPYKILKSQPIYRGRAVQLAVDRVELPNGTVMSREIIHHPGAAVMIPLLDKNTILLIRQFRYSAARFIWEFPAGTASPGEAPLRCARRELEEETGYKARSWKKLLTFYPTPGVSTEVMHLYLAWNLKKTQAHPEEDEILELKTFRVTEIDRMIRAGQIIDGKTILGFHHFMRYHRR